MYQTFDYSENENSLSLQLIIDNGYHYFLSIAAIQSTVVYPSYRMATSQEWIIDQKERVFLKVKTKKKISKDLFRNRSDSAIRFRSNPVENYGSIYLNFFLENYGEYGHMPNSVIEFMNKVL